LKRLHLFKPGRHTAASGVSIDFSEAQLQATATAYDPAKHEAPIVVGHPKHDLPAYGWVKSLGFAEGELDAEPHQVDAAFAELVAAGRYKKISASFYRPDAPMNPVPGVYYLRHVGFLGAQPPAVKGLKAVEFADAEEGVIEFSDWNDMTNAGLWRNLRDWFIEQFGKDKADNVLPDYSISQLATAAAQEPAATAGMPAYSENPTTRTTMTPAEIAAREAALKTQADAQTKKDEEQRAKDATFAERETRLAAEETKRARAEILTFVDGLVKEGKVLPAHQEGLVSFMVGIAPAQVIEFSEGDKKVSKPGTTWLRDYLTAQPKLVEFKEVGKGDGSENAADDPQAIANLALEFQESEKKAGREISVTAAVQHVTKTAAK
jgi:hypothetical protein